MTDDSSGPDPDRPRPDATAAAHSDLLALAESLAELPLAGVEPVLGPPRWR